MAKKENVVAGGETGRFPSADLIQDYKPPAFLIRKASIELKVTLNGKNVSVAVSLCSPVCRPLAESIARVQQQIMSAEIRAYCGQNPYAFLLALYNHQGWAIQQLENAATAKQKESGK